MRVDGSVSLIGVEGGQSYVRGAFGNQIVHLLRVRQPTYIDQFDIDDTKGLRTQLTLYISRIAPFRILAAGDDVRICRP